MIEKRRPSQTGGIPIDWALPFFEQQGVSFQRFCQHEALTESAENEDAHTVSMSVYLRFLNWAAEQLNDPVLGLAMAEHIDPNTMGLLGYLISNGSTLRETLEFMQRYHDIFSTELSYYLIDEGDTHRLVYNEPQNSSIDPRQDILFSLAMCCSGIGQFRESDQPLGRCSFTFSAPQDLQKMIECFGDQLAFDQPTNFVEFESTLLDQINPHHDANLLQILVHQANQIIDQLNVEQDLVQRLRLLITASLEVEILSIDSAAQHLHMSVRTLRRHLSDRGTSFRKLREDIIIKIAQEALIETDLSITELASKLNYSETSAFDRLFKRVVGQTPRGYRQKHRTC